MSEQECQALLRSLAELCRRYPQWRFGQLVWNVAGWADAHVWDVEDGQMLAAVTSLLDGGPDPAGKGTGPVILGDRGH